MSGHLIGCAKPTNLPASHKLALVAYADSADDRTHIGFAGYAGVMEWAGVSRSRAAELIKDLVTWGYLQPHKAARRGQRAEYVVFPHGCCDLHRTPAEEPAVDAGQLAAAAGISLDQARDVLTALSIDAVVPDAAQDAHPQGSGSGVLDTSPPTGSEAPDPNQTVVHRSTAEPVDNGADGVQRVQMGSSASDPFTTSKAITPLPPQAVDGLAVVDGQVYIDGVAVRCPAHPTGHRRCRFCGTTPKALAASGARQAKRAEDERRRAGQIAIRERERALSGQSARQRDPAKAAESLRAAKAGVAAARAASKNGGNR